MPAKGYTATANAVSKRGAAKIKTHGTPWMFTGPPCYEYTEPQDNDNEPPLEGDVQFARNQQCRSCGSSRPTRLGAGMSLEPHWSSHGEGWNIVPAGPAETEALQIGLRPGGTLGGRDQRTALTYKGMGLACAWRIQHPGLWGKYAMERENIKSMEMKALREVGVSTPPVDIRGEFQLMAQALPAELDAGINEVFLTHGSKPESVLEILGGGLNERFSGGLFGAGTYFAEDITKNDQYCTYDEAHGAHPELHKLLYDDTGLVHPGRVLYVFVCRVILGHRIRTKDGQTDLDSPGRSIWSSQSRELAVIEGSNPPVIHHSLLAELGQKIVRFREFVVFHGDRIYPEYLIAYTRA